MANAQPHNRAESEPLTAVDGGRLRVAPSVMPALEAAGLATLDALMNYRGGVVYRNKDGRSTIRVELPDPAGGTLAVFIKRHGHVPCREKLRRLLSLRPPMSTAEAETQAIRRVADCGVDTMRLLAVGEELSARGLRERSCLITEEVHDGLQADAYCQQTFGSGASREAVAAKRRFIRSLARAAARFHGAGLTHRDFYLCHFLVRPAAGAEPALHLIDLQRVLYHPHGQPRRWQIKDLGSLLFSSWPGPGTRIVTPVFTRTDAMRFAHEYFGVKRLASDARPLIRSVIAKARRIAQRQQRIERRRNKDASLPSPTGGEG